MKFGIQKYNTYNCSDIVEVFTIIGNGDVTNVETYSLMINETNCDAVMIGRGALGNPWIFRDILNFINKENQVKLSLEEIIKTSIEHIELLKEYKHQKVAINLSKKHLSYYLKGFNNASSYRKKIMSFDNIDDIEDYLHRIN